jgi:hypothetical protein
MSEKIQVREGWWRQRCDNVVRIVDGGNFDPCFPWRCAAGNVYAKDGQFLTYKQTELDLVEFLGVEDPTRRPAQDDRRELVRQLAVALLTRHGDSLTPHDAWDLAMRMADAEPKGV